jgi:tetratricopeptide (TPR) repeat protein
MVIALVPINFDLIWRDRHRYWKNLDRLKTGEYLGKPIWHDREQVGICDNHRKHVKSWHAYRIFAANLVTRQYLIDDGMSHSETPPLEQLLRSNIGDALFTLARYRDAAANYRAAREEIERSLAASPNAGPFVIADLLSKLGYVDISLARIGADPAGQTRGIATLACALRLARAAGLNGKADSISAGLADEQQRLAPTAYSEALRGRAPFKPCQAT